MARKRSVILSGAKNLAKGDRRGELRDQEEALAGPAGVPAPTPVAGS
jgi:hypothetical protein